MSDIQVWSDQDQVAEIKKIYAPQLTDGEFATLCQIGKATNTNPFMREIWAVKYGNQAAQIFIGRDGYRKIAQANDDYDYHFVDAVYSNDKFEVSKAEIDHSYNLADRGSLVGAYALVQRKSSSKPVFVFVEFSEYNTGKSVWKDKPATMIKKVAEAQCLRMAFQSLFAGTYDESEVGFTEKPQRQHRSNVIQTQDAGNDELYQEMFEKLSKVQSLEGYEVAISLVAEQAGNLSNEQKNALRELAGTVKQKLAAPSNPQSDEKSVQEPTGKAPKASPGSKNDK